jgi:hypothetical protein
MRVFLLGSAVVVGCTSEGSDSASTEGAGSASGWHADTVAFQASFAYDAATGQLVPASMGSTAVDPTVVFFLADWDDYNESPSPTHYCFVTWDVRGSPAPVATYENYWLSLDLVGLPRTYDTSVGDCEGMQSAFAQDRGSATLDDLVDSLAFSIGVRSLDDTSENDLEFWEEIWSSYWSYDATYGSWDSYEPYMAAGAFANTFTKGVPYEASVVLPFVVDETTWAVRTDESGETTPVDLTGASALPTAFYHSMSMYYVGEDL